MPLALIRIDERLLHGQVVVGWGQRLDLRWYVVADDDLADSEWEQKLYAGGLPERVRAEFWTVDRTIADMEELDARDAPGALLTRGTGAMRRLAEAGVLDGRRVNLGCLGGTSGRREALPYLHLSPEEARDVEELVERSLEVRARDVPGARAVPAEKVLDAARD